MRAASSISGGIWAKKARSIQMAKGSAKAVFTRTRAKRLSIRFILANMAKSGTRTTIEGKA